MRLTKLEKRILSEIVRKWTPEKDEIYPNICGLSWRCLESTKRLTPIRLHKIFNKFEQLGLIRYTVRKTVFRPTEKARQIMKEDEEKLLPIKNFCSLNLEECTMKCDIYKPKCFWKFNVRKTSIKSFKNLILRHQYADCLNCRDGGYVSYLCIGRDHDQYLDEVTDHILEIADIFDLSEDTIRKIVQEIKTWYNHKFTYAKEVKVESLEELMR